MKLIISFLMPPKLMIFNAVFKVVLQNKKPQTTPIYTDDLNRIYVHLCNLW